MFSFLKRKEKKNYVEMYQLCSGTFLNISEVSDPVFSDKLMGDGFAVKPNGPEVYSPVCGEVVTIFETKHAIGIKANSGLEILVHMGIDTVTLNGEPFEVLVNEGDQVTQDTLLAKVDMEKIKEAGKSNEMIAVITNMDKVNKIQWKENISGEEGTLVANIII